MMQSVYEHGSDISSENSFLVPTAPAPTPAEELQAAKKEIDVAVSRIDERLDQVDKTIAKHSKMLGCTKRFAEKFKRASNGGRI